jgi:hypothetical protein
MQRGCKRAQRTDLLEQLLDAAVHDALREHAKAVELPDEDHVAEHALARRHLRLGRLAVLALGRDQGVLLDLTLLALLLLDGLLGLGLGLRFGRLLDGLLAFFALFAVGDGLHGQHARLELDLALVEQRAAELQRVALRVDELGQRGVELGHQVGVELGERRLGERLVEDLVDEADERVGHLALVDLVDDLQGRGGEGEKWRRTSRSEAGRGRDGPSA